MNLYDSKILKNQLDALLAIIDERGNEVDLPNTDLTLTVTASEGAGANILSCVHYSRSIGEVVPMWTLHYTDELNIERFTLGADPDEASLDSAIDFTGSALSSLH